MSGLVEILDAMEAKIVAAVASSDFDVQVRGRMIGNASPPTIDIYPGEPSRDDNTTGFGEIMGELIFTVRARVATNDSEAQQELLLSFMDDEHDLSIAAALEADQTLDGLASSVDANQLTGFLSFPDPSGESLLGCQWVVTVVNAP